MNKYIYPTSLLCDFYKISHREQYPQGTEYILSTWTPRTSRIKNINKIVAFGIQSFIKEYLITYFNENFFNRPKQEVVDEYIRVIKHTLGVEQPETQHIEALHDLGYLPLKIRAVKEGTLVPIRVPMLTIENTNPEFFWLTNFLETLMSNEIWSPSTSATLAFEYRKILQKYAEETNGDTSGVQFQGHDFSMRGMSSLGTSKSNGAGHLLSFVGTDTIPAILYHEEFYNANIENELIGTSIPATEHSCMMANGKDEVAAIKRLITEVYPSGFVSIVSDTWDFWNVVNVVYRELKDTILARNGRVVVRPDSGDPVKIICGDPEAEDEIVRKGLVEVLWDIFGGTITDKGYKQLDTHIGAIYGDSITIERCTEICEQLKQKGFASTNMVYGIGSFTYQYNTRDTFGFALKSTYVVIDGVEHQIYKDPKTDNGVKKSQKGLVIVKQSSGTLEYVDGLNRSEYEQMAHLDVLEDVFVDGNLVRDEKLSEIRERLLSNL